MLLAAIILGLRVPFAAPLREAVLKSFALAPPDPPPPPPPPPPPRESPSRPKQAAAPPNLPAEATPVVAPPPIVPPPLPPPPVTAAPVPGFGVQPSQGAAERPGPGTGAGGIGDGRGGGGRGDGDGDGDGEGGDTPPRLARGRLGYGDLPAWLRDTERSVRMELRYVIEVDGRVSRCGVDRSSGYPEVDALICRLIRERFRFRPALDEDGDPVRSTMIQRQEFIARPEDE